MGLGYLFSFQGRVNRAKLWLLLLLSLVGGGVLEFLVVALTGGMNGSGMPDPSGSEDTATGLGTMVVGLAFAILNLSFQVRRCHDRDRSGWFVLLWSLPILNIWGLIELYFLSGTPGLNRFGPDPLGRGFRQTAEVFR